MASNNRRAGLSALGNLNQGLSSGTSMPQPPQVEVVDWAAVLLSKIPEGLQLQASQLKELELLGQVLNKNNGSYELMEYLTISDGIMDDGQTNPYLIGRAVLQIPESAFHTNHPGYFQMKLTFPEVREGGTIEVRVQVSHRVLDNHSVLLSTGGGNGSGDGWSNFSSNYIPLYDLLSRQPFADSESTFVQMSELLADWVGDIRLDSSRNQLLCPQGDVILVIKANIIPYNQDKAPKLNGPLKGKPGDPVAVGIETAYFNACTIEATTGFNGRVINPTAPKTFDDFLALSPKYKTMLQRPVVNPPLVNPQTNTVVSNIPVSAADIDAAFGEDTQQFVHQALAAQ